MTADGLVVASLVYWSSVNGLTKIFLDKRSLSGFEGKPAFAITVAGGFWQRYGVGHQSDPWIFWLGVPHLTAAACLPVQL